MTKSRLTLIVLLLVAFGLRLFRLAEQSLWWDEGISLHLATTAVPDLILNRATNIHPPLYFLGLKGWLALVGVGPFQARYLSLLASFLQVAAVYGLSRRWFGGRVAWMAVVLITLSPLSIVYGQETRVYALLPLIYLVLLAAAHYLTRPTATPAWGWWIGLGAAEWVGFHLHYISVLIILYVNGWLVLAWWRQGRWAAWRRWLLVQLGVGLASLPWVTLLLIHSSAVRAVANNRTYLSESVPFSFLVSQIWVFHLTGLPGLLARPVVQLLAGLIAVSLMLLLISRGWRRQAQVMPLAMLPHWLLPVAAAFVVWSLRSFSHPRYVAIFAVGLMVLAASLIELGRQNGRSWGTTLLSGLLMGGLVVLSLYSLASYFFDPALAKDDIRGVGRYLAAAATADDLILVPDTDWSLFFEYEGAAPVAMPQVAAGAAMWPHLTQLTQGKARVFAVDYEGGTLDWQERAAFVLEKEGVLVDEVFFDNVRVRTYGLAQAVTPPQWTAVNGRFRPILLTDAWVEPATPANSALAVALRWRLPQPVAERYHIALQLTDVDGWQLAAVDDLLADERGRPTEFWPPGATITTYHRLSVPLGTPPLAYDLQASVYLQDDGREPYAVDLLNEQGAPQGQRLLLAEGTAVTPAVQTTDFYGTGGRVPPLPAPISFAEGLLLVGASLERQVAGAGQPLFVRLQWQATQPLADVRPRLALVQAGQVWAESREAPVLGRYPTNEWRAGEQVVEHRRLTIPPTAVGEAAVVLQLEEVAFEVGWVEIAAEARLLDAPAVMSPLDVTFGQVARLVGYDLPQSTVTTADKVPLTLYWQSLTTGSEIDYVVFAHVLAADGHLIGQHDAVPDNGRRPTGGWVAGEYIIDPHEMVFQEAYAGEGRIEVGLYDPQTGVRLVADTGDDFYYLPTVLMIEGGGD